ncbi:MAG: histidine--tRNA ligase [Candidatus Dependentiae bacterium]|nr:histidine--tRNA ligase [Candidatus Dependentiae bacterium]
MIQNIRGTQDFIDLGMYNFIVRTAQQYLGRYGYEEISLPILESTDLFRRSLGLATDVVNKEMFVVQSASASEKAEREQICLRPEMTASVMRAYFTNGIQQLPWRVFSHGPVFRYERPQKGRYREFHQLTVELLGAQSLAFDAEFIAMVDNFLRQGLQINSYVIALNFLGTLEDRTNYKRALLAFLEKQDNLPRAIAERKETNLLRIFDLKDEESKQALKGAPTLIEYLSPESAAAWRQLTSMLDQLSVNYVHDPYLVRGLDYYSNTVFEFVSSGLGAQNAICGGGRYDGLSLALGEKNLLPAIGVGFGIERLMLLLAEQRPDFKPEQKPALVAILPLSGAQEMLALLCAQNLREWGICTEVLLDGTSVKSMMRRANRLGARYAILIGENEQKDGTLTVKEMMSGEERIVKQDELVGALPGLV